MKTQVLRVVDDLRNELLRMEWLGGGARTVVIHVADELRPDVERWLRYGLDELVGHGPDVVPRNTPASDEAFLGRLADYLERQSALSVSYRELLARLAPARSEDETQVAVRSAKDFNARGYSLVGAAAMAICGVAVISSSKHVLANDESGPVSTATDNVVARAHA